jgi:8-hydroxy-5-deazaflavin:NADPH oxidoreductase
MKVGVLGSGMVGRAIAAKTAEIGHGVVLGTRDPSATLARSEPDAMGTPPFAGWHGQHPGVRLSTFADAAGHGEIVFNATNGSAALEALALAGADALRGKTLVDISNPLDFSHGMPPSLFVSNTDSLGEQIQRAYPDAKVVKALNTMNASLMVDPRQLAGGDHDAFVAGNDAGAKAEVVGVLRDWFGWKRVHDLGDITAARALEMYMPLWLLLFGAVGSPSFNVKIVTERG